MTYKDAQKQLKKEGAKNATGAAKNLCYAYGLSILCCMTEKSIFEWAERHSIDLHEQIYKKITLDNSVSAKMDLVEMVLDDNTKYLVDKVG